jgi:hypothetical protein
LFGPKGCGKTQFREAFLHLFGQPQASISLESASSPKGFLRRIAQFYNAIISFEEYKNSINPNLIGMMKNLYDRIGYERAQMTNDNKTHSSPVNSTCIIAGQQMPTKENALFSRSILLEFKKDTWSNEEKRDYERLKAMQEDGLGNVLLEMLSYRGFIKKDFKSVFKSIYNQLKAAPELAGIIDRSIQNVASILAPFKILEGWIEFPFTWENLLELAISNIKTQDETMQRSNEVNQFWEIFFQLVNGTYLISEEDYLIEEINNKIYLANYPKIYKNYREHALKSGVDPLDQESLRSYLKIESYFIPAKGQSDQMVKKFSGTPKRCYAFDYKTLKEKFVSTSEEEKD